MSRSEILAMEVPILPTDSEEAQVKIVPAQQYLKTYGYLPHAYPEGRLDPDTQAALSRYKIRARLGGNAVVDRVATLGMGRRRCGARDENLADLFASSELAADCHTCGWPQKELTFAVTNMPLNARKGYTGHLAITPAQVRAALDAAANTWNAEVGHRVRLRRVANLSNARIKVFWDNDLIGEESLAQASYPPCCTGKNWVERLPVQFRLDLDENEFWFSHGLPVPEELEDEVIWWDLESIALHEFGHALGVYHTVAGDVMFWAPSEKTAFNVLQPGDQQSAQATLAGYPPEMIG